MSTVVFGAEYAAAYDALYQDKDYGAECDLIEHVFGAYGSGPIKRVLDLGCGSGGHAMPLAERGYAVLGVDRSPHMLDQARARTSTAHFSVGDLTNLDLGQTFDAVLMMFAVLSYQVGNVDVQGALTSARRHLRPGGLLVADAWYGPAVLQQRPGERVKVVEAGGVQVIRAASAELDTRAHACTVEYHVWRLADRQVLDETRERHRMRYFFPLELELLLHGSGFELVRLGAFPQIETEPDQSTWNVAIVARAV